MKEISLFSRRAAVACALFLSVLCTVTSFITGKYMLPYVTIEEVVFADLSPHNANKTNSSSDARVATEYTETDFSQLPSDQKKRTAQAVLRLTKNVSRCMKFRQAGIVYSEHIRKSGGTTLNSYLHAVKGNDHIHIHSEKRAFPVSCLDHENAKRTLFTVAIREPLSR